MSAEDDETEAQGLIWITEAIVKYRHGRSWFNRRLESGQFHQVKWPGSIRIYLRKDEVDTYVTEHPEEQRG